MSLGLSPTINGAMYKNDQDRDDVFRKLNERFGNSIPADLTDDVAVEAAAAAMRKTPAREFRKLVARLRRLEKDATLLRKAAKEIGEPRRPEDAAADFAEMKKICPVWGTW